MFTFVKGNHTTRSAELLSGVISWAFTLSVMFNGEHSLFYTDFLQVVGRPGIETTWAFLMLLSGTFTIASAVFWRAWPRVFAHTFGFATWFTVFEVLFKSHQYISILWISLVLMAFHLIGGALITRYRAKAIDPTHIRRSSDRF